MSAAEHVGCIPGQCRAGDQWRATGCGAEVDGATWGGGPSAEGGVEALVEAIRAEADKYGVTRSAMAGCGVWTVSVAQVPDIVRAGLAARSQRPEDGGPSAEGALTEAERRDLVELVALEFYEATQHYLHSEWLSWPHLPDDQKRWWREKAEDGIVPSLLASPALAAHFRGRAVVAVASPNWPCDCSRSQRPEGVAVTEWGVVVDDLGSTDMAESEEQARTWLANGDGLSLVRVVVTEWAEVSGDTEAGDPR